MEPQNDSASGDAGADTARDDAAADAAERKAAADQRATEEKEKLLAGMKALTAAEILADQPLATEWVPVPKWGGKVLVRELTGTERDEFEASIVTQKGKHRVPNTENIRAKLARLSIVDPTDPKGRAPLFTVKQMAQLGKKDAASLDLIFDTASRLSGLSKEDVEELEGNSEGAGSGDSLPS